VIRPPFIDLLCSIIMSSTRKRARSAHAQPADEEASKRSAASPKAKGKQSKAAKNQRTAKERVAGAVDASSTDRVVDLNESKAPVSNDRDVHMTDASGLSLVIEHW